MPLVDTHLLQDKPKQGKVVSQKKQDEYDRVERLIEEIQCDLVNGVLRYTIFRKFKERLYENLGDKNIGDRQIQNYITAAWHKMKEDRIDKIQELRDMLFSQYMSQYNEATATGNVIAAKSCLDSIARIFLPDEKNINLNANVQGDISVNFNFIEEDEG
jgi:hypothetical protein